MFEYEKKTEIIRIIKQAGAYNFTNAVLAFLHDQTTPEKLNKIENALNPYQLADLLNDTVFCTKLFEIKQEGLKRKILLSQEEILNENTDSQTSQGDNGL